MWWEKGLPDFTEDPNSAYTNKIDSARYEAEKGLLELYRAFVVEMLRISLAGVVVLGFLSKLSRQTLGDFSVIFGTISMGFFAASTL